VFGNVKWTFTSNVTGFNETVYENGLLFEEFRPRFSLNTSVYGLDISNVQLNDAGNYTCIGGHGRRDIHIHNLIVQGT